MWPMLRQSAVKKLRRSNLVIELFSLLAQLRPPLKLDTLLLLLLVFGFIEIPIFVDDCLGYVGKFLQTIHLKSTILIWFSSQLRTRSSVTVDMVQLRPQTMKRRSSKFFVK